MNLPIVYCYPGCRWNDMPPGRQRLLSEALSAHTLVLYLDTPHFKGPMDVRRPRIRQVAENLIVVQDAWGFRGTAVGWRLGKVAAIVDGIWLHSAFRSVGVHDYIYWLSAADPFMLWGMNTDRLVMDCIDPCFDPASQAMVNRKEAAIARRAKLVFCTAESLLERMKAYNPHSYLLPNACAPRDYHVSMAPPRPLPPLLHSRPRPIIGYLGTINSRFDASTLFEAAQRLPGFTFALIGRVNGDQDARLRDLRELPNVVMPGQVSEEEGKAYVSAFDVGLVPFIAGPINDAVNPVKMYMYLVAGKPVVSTWLRECHGREPYVTAARTIDEFVGALRNAVQDRDAGHREERISFAMQNTWQDRAGEAVKRLKECGLFHPSISP